MNTDELSVLMCELEGKMRTEQTSLQEVELQEIALGRQILELQLKRKDLQASISKAKYNLKQTGSQLREAKTKYFNSREGR